MIEIIISCCYFTLIHLWILLFYYGIISAENIMIFLYLSNIILIANNLKNAEFSLIFETVKEHGMQIIADSYDEQVPAFFIFENILDSSENITQVSTPCSSDIDVEKHCDSTSSTKLKQPNLYIQKWKEQFLSPGQRFPLDRLAYLTAKYYNCTEDTCFILNNFHLKSLVNKGDYKPDKDYTDEPHPRKLVNDLSSVYIHRRAAFFRKRYVNLADSKQFTLRGKRLSDVTGSDEKERRSSLAEKLSATYSRFRESMGRESAETDDESSDDEEKVPRRKSLWKRLSLHFKNVG